MSTIITILTLENLFRVSNFRSSFRIVAMEKESIMFIQLKITTPSKNKDDKDANQPSQDSEKKEQSKHIHGSAPEE